MSTFDNSAHEPGIPWQTLMAFGFGHLRLSPAGFWAMTLREISLAADFAGSGGTREPPISRDNFDNLVRAYPDEDWRS